MVRWSGVGRAWRRRRDSGVESKGRVRRYRGEGGRARGRARKRAWATWRRRRDSGVESKGRGCGYKGEGGASKVAGKYEGEGNGRSEGSRGGNGQVG